MHTDPEFIGMAARLLLAVRDLFDPTQVPTYTPNQLLGARVLSPHLAVVLRFATEDERERGVIVALVFRTPRDAIRLPVLGVLLRDTPRAILLWILRAALAELERRRWRPSAEMI